MTEERGRRRTTAEASPKVPMRERLAEAAFALFLERGFEQTTVDDIVARAGVGRRSFFRYFPSKEDAVFPDHDRCLDDMTAFLRASEDPDPVSRVCDAARIVMRMYTAKPEFSVQRYRMTRDVPGLRTYELSVVRRYERKLAGYLRDCWGGDPRSELRAEVVAAAVVAAHNNVLRSWLRSGGTGDPEERLAEAFALVRGMGDGTPRQPVPDDDVIVMVTHKRAPLWRVVQEVESALQAD